MSITTRLTAPTSGRQLELGLGILRIVTGLIFAVHGGQKLFVFGFDGVAGAFAGMGVPLAGLVGPAVALLEFFGGLALIAGFLTRPVALLLAATMLGALLLVHLPAGFFLPNGYEFVLALLGAVATLAITGAGRWSLDERLFGRRASGSSDVQPIRRAA
ncbi:MAG TPA: DoxX family protein [Sorangium sp.]|nr:DoxX family protein [Sorangium sp.]